MYTNLQKEKRKTKMVRVREDLHKELKIEAASQEISMAQLLNKMWLCFSDKCKQEVRGKSLQNE